MDSVPVNAGDETFDAVLFDMDGTILTSRKAAERVWAAWAAKFGIDLETFLPTIHGVRAVDTIRKQAIPGVDPEREADWITQAEMVDVAGIEPIPGAAEFLSALPADRWAVVTSAPRELACRRIEAAGLPRPPVLVAADDVERGKPAPDCFLLGAQRLGVDPRRCLVFEDAAAGITAADAAGCALIVITATREEPAPARFRSSRDYTTLRVTATDGRLRVVGWPQG